MCMYREMTERGGRRSGSRGRGRGTRDDPEVHKVAKKPGKGVRLVSQSKSIIENVRVFFEREKKYGMSLKRSNVLKRTAEATGMPVTTVKRIHQEYISHDMQFLTPVKRYAASRLGGILTVSTVQSLNGWFIDSTTERSILPSLGYWRRPSGSAIFQVGGSVCGGY